jgi:hypothetical protein
MAVAMKVITAFWDVMPYSLARILEDRGGRLL